MYKLAAKTGVFNATARKNPRKIRDAFVLVRYIIEPLVYYRRPFLYPEQVNYYAVQVKTRSEEKFIKLLRAMYPEVDFPIFFPKRRIDIKRRGLISQSTTAVFPGYLFIEVDERESILRHQWAFRRTDGFLRFLKSNQDIRPMNGRDLELALHFIKNVGPVAGKSRVYFNENSRIVVVEGPLMGLEGRIIKVDKRKRRAKIKLDLYNDSFSIDLGFEVIGALERR
jgi:transcriptional antiterminator NusG